MVLCTFNCEPNPAGRVTWPPSGLESADLTVRHAGRRGRALASATAARTASSVRADRVEVPQRQHVQRLRGGDLLCRLPSARPQRSPHGGFRAPARIR